MNYVITGASGPFGRGVTGHLLDSGIAPESLILVTRSPDRLSATADMGARVRYGDFDDYDSLVSAFAGGEKLLMISALKVGFRIPQHGNAIRAAVQAGMKHVFYTSFIGKEPDNPSLAVADHRGTEKMLRDSGLIWTSLRNAQYADAMVEAAPRVPLRTGVWQAATSEGRMPLITRTDCIAAAAAALVAQGCENSTFNITGPERLTYREVSQIIAEVAGKPIVWEEVDRNTRYAFFDAMGVPRVAVPDQSVDAIPWSSDDIVSMELAIRDGWFDIESNDFLRLTGYAPQSFRQFALERQADLRALAAGD